MAGFCPSVKGFIIQAYYALFLEKKNTETVYCFFDETQIILGWEAFTDRLLRTEKCEVYITGSSAQMLSKEIATQMRGRSLTWELFPFSFAEYLDHKGITYGASLTGKKKALLQNAFEKYWETGAFPEVANLDKSLAMFQVCESMVSPETRKRELSALEEGVKEQGLTTGTIVTRNETEQIRTDLGIINIVPIWSFLLQIDNHSQLM